MFASTKAGLPPMSYPFRWTARAAAIILFALWLVFVAAEALLAREENNAFNTYGQAASLAIVFAGYAVGWRRELAGGIAAIVGTFAFFAVVLSTIGKMPGLAVLLYAVPGVLYLLAWHYDERRHIRVTQ